MSANIVQAQYEQLEQIAARFATAADTQQALLQRVNQRVDVLRQGGWQGKGVAAFLREMDGEVGPAVGRLIDSFAEAGEATRRSSAVIRQAEVEAASLFQSANIADHGIEDPPNNGIDFAIPLTHQPIGAVELHNAADLYNAIADDSAPPIRILRLGDGPDGKGEYVVLIKGTKGWIEETPRTWYANARSGLGIPTEYTESIRAAIEQAGIPAGATIHFAGHSQGGHNAQILGKMYDAEGKYQVGSVTSFGAYQVVSLSDNIPVNTYMFPTDPINLPNLLRDTAISIAPIDRRLLLGAMGVKPHIDDWVLEIGGHHDYGRSPTMQQTPLPFSASRGELVNIPSQYSDPRNRDILHKVADEMWDSAGHVTAVIVNPLLLLSL